MSFAVRSTHIPLLSRIPGSSSAETTSSIQAPPKQEVKKQKLYTQEDMDIIDAKYRERLEKIRSFIEDPANPILEQYKKQLLSELTFEKETIIYDKNTKQWKLVRDSDVKEENNQQ